MKNILIAMFLMSLACHLSAQKKDNITVAGTVMDKNGETLIGVSVVPKGQPGKGAITDIDGKFRLRNLSKNTTLVFSFIGYTPLEEVIVGSKEGMKITLEEKVSNLDEVVVVGQGTQRKISVVGAITSVSPASLQVPATSVSNMLGGRVPGIISVTRSGEPGKDFSAFWIRGISTFGANSSALVLIDGVEGNLNNLDPSDIESFSVLKDASATAVYGVRGANGVVVVTTNRGRAGKLVVNFKTSKTLSYSARQPNYVDAATYGALANEARVVRGLTPKYTDLDLALFGSGLDSDLYPNVNWRDVILKDHTWDTQHYLSASGGGTNARFFMSLGYLNKEAVFKQDQSAHTYNTNVDYSKYSFRANIDMDLTKTTLLSLGLDQTIVNQNAPGYGDDNDALWSAQANLTPVLVPVKYSNGQLPAYGSNADQMSPYVLLNYTGYKQTNINSGKVNISLTQSLGFITKGLSVNGLFSYVNNGGQNIKRYKLPDLYYATGRLNDGSLDTRRTMSKADISYSSTAYVDRQSYFELRTNYERIFGDHRVSGLLHYYVQNYSTSTATTAIAAIPKKYQALSGRATYSFKDTYFIEGNVGYTGSENFKPGSQYGWFPAVAAGWVPTQYNWTKENIPFFNYFKFRYSIGKVGNDRITDTRFPYLTTVKGSNNSTWGSSGTTEDQVGSDNLRWETAKKYDFGIDTHFWHDKFDLTVDFFKDVRTGIFQQRVLPSEVGVVTAPWANVGAMKSTGVDGNLSYTQQIGKDFSMTFRGNFTFAQNEVTNWEQADIRYPYQSYTGVPYGVLRGLVALGLFKDKADVASSPRQTFRSEVLPGDIKYKDVNGDGIINADDEVPLSYSNTPQIQYGFASEFRWKNWSLSIFFEGTGKANFFYGGSGYYPFAWESTGNVLDIVADQNNRWTPASYSGTTATENPNARFPRLTYGNNENNNRASTFWLADASYLRLKNVEVSYRLVKPWLKKCGVSCVTFSLYGDNLACWDKVKIWDPGQASSNGAVYPLQRTFTFQLNAQF